MFYFFKTYIFWRAGRGKIGGKKMWKNISSICKTYIFWRAGRGKIGGKKWKDLSCCDAFLELALEETYWKCTVVLIAKNIDFFCFHVFFEKQMAKNIGEHLCFKTIVTEKFAEKTTKHVL